MSDGSEGPDTTDEAESFETTDVAESFETTDVAESSETTDRAESFEVVVEIPQGSRNKYEIDHETDEVWLDRHLFAATVYPAEYGYFPGSLAEDGDPLDALVLLEDPTFPGCHIRARPVAVLEMSDEAGRDLKVLCVPAGDPRWEGVVDLQDVDPYLLAEIRHFFEVYKDLEPDKGSVLGGWSGRGEALAAIEDARARHAD